MKEKLSIDTAVETIAYLIGGAIRDNQTADIDRLQREKNVILGLSGTPEEREQLFDKVKNEYSPQIKATIQTK